MKRGFTLIELLAVIVILAIIALIAVPIVINIINDSKTSSDEQSVELYLDAVEKTITKNQLNNPNFNPDKCKILNNGDLECYKDNKKIKTLQMEVKGTTPEKGTIELKDNKFIYKNILLNGKHYYERGILVNDADNNNEISIGDKYTYKVNDEDTFYFYVLSFNGDDTVSLIMNRNICEDGKIEYNQDNKFCKYSWDETSDDSSNGPITVMQILYKATKNWNNIPNVNLSGEKAYRDEGNAIDNRWGYGKIETLQNGIKITKKDDTESIIIPYESNKPLKARISRYDEVTSEITNCTGNSGSCESWLVENLRWNGSNKYSINENNGITNIHGYWTMSSTPKCINCGPKIITWAGCTNTASARDTLNSGGIRPVITVPISDLE